jgi:hypothetical protein
MQSVVAADDAREREGRVDGDAAAWKARARSSEPHQMSVSANSHRAPVEQTPRCGRRTEGRTPSGLAPGPAAQVWRRSTGATDGDAVARLAALDERRGLKGRVLLALLDGRAPSPPYPASRTDGWWPTRPWPPQTQSRSWVRGLSNWSAVPDAGCSGIGRACAWPLPASVRPGVGPLASQSCAGGASSARLRRDGARPQRPPSHAMKF